MLLYESNINTLGLLNMFFFFLIYFVLFYSFFLFRSPTLVILFRLFSCCLLCVLLMGLQLSKHMTEFAAKRGKRWSTSKTDMLKTQGLLGY